MFTNLNFNTSKHPTYLNFQQDHQVQGGDLITWLWAILWILTSTLVLTWSPGGIIREIIEVPLPLAACRDLINFLTFHISTFLSDEFSSAILTNFIYLFSDWNCNKRNGSDTDLQIKRKKNTWIGIIIIDLVNSNLRLNTIKGDKRISMVFNGKH